MKQKLDKTTASWSENKQCFCLGKTRLRGITRVAREVFYPQEKRVRYTPDFPDRKAAPGSGFSRGLRVDREITTWVNSGRRPAGAHKWTIDIAKVLNREGLTPLRAQVAVHDQSSRLGTACDLVCASSCGHFVVVELKCGYEGGYAKSRGFMQKSLQGLPDSPYCQHQLQLILTMHLFSKTFGVRTVKGIVVRASREGVYLYAARPKLASFLPKILRSMQ
jgi:hypothetical protein